MLNALFPANVAEYSDFIFLWPKFAQAAYTQFCIDRTKVSQDNCPWRTKTSFSRTSATETAETSIIRQMDRASPSTVAFAQAAVVRDRQAFSHASPFVCRVTVNVRMTLANESRYVGEAPVTKRGRLRVDFDRYASDVGDAALSVPLAQNAESYRWSSEGYNKVTRSVGIWGFIARLLFVNYLNNKRWTYFLLDRSEERVRARRRALAAWAREEILNLGPTLIKVGQLAAARADIFPSEVIQELAVLQDKVPAFKWEAANAILERSYGKPVEEIFRYIDKQPLAAASLGQVHRAQLPSGEEVILKVQRPGLQELFNLDLDALETVATFLQNSKKYGGKTRDWIGIYNECRKVLFEEIDYIAEARNCERFRSNFASVPYVKIPKAYMDYTTPTVLCLQFIPGLDIRNREALLGAGIDPKLVARRSAELLLKQILDYAFFTADPHAGNVAVSPQLGGSIILYDFGMVGALNPKIKERLVDILIGVIEKDAEVVMNTLVDLGALVLPADPVPVRRSIQYFLDSVGSRPNREQTVAAIGDDLYATAYDKPFRLPAESIFLLRALSTLEGVNKTLDPDFKFSEVAQPYADELLRGRGQSQYDMSNPQSILKSLAAVALSGKSDAITDQLRRRVAGAGSNAIQAGDRIEKIEKAFSRLERGDLKVRARATETERLLRQQNELSVASNYLVMSVASAILALQVFTSSLGALSTDGGGILATLSAMLGIIYVRRTAKAKKIPFANSDDT